ncbi:uncharacterized protein LOC106512401 [Austrofundulus limnaeus]|uniref:Uncharacterized protein LOC106512401 n=1 Tax=Austrofundulus limnaeus TaxID=52670 RepID=A0A2I4ALW1_AUSLI|nr:PREDICTED: uncharacterized protein LOC106512401 [Austrofundulus limnaeus]
MLVDSGATFTCVHSRDAIHLPMSGKFARTIGFEGKKQLIPFTKPVDISCGGQRVKMPILVSDNTPTGLLGRDALCELNCTIQCTPDGCQVQFPKESNFQLPMLTDNAGPSVCWIGDLTQDLLEPARVWEKFILANVSEVKRPQYPPHCTLKYFKTGLSADMDVWLDQQPEQVQLTSSCIIVGPQGVAMKIDPNDFLLEQHEIKDSVPHVTLFVAKDYEQKHVGNMMVEAQDIVFKPLKENINIWRSEDQQYLTIMISAQGSGKPQVVQMVEKDMCNLQVDPEDLKAEMLQQGDAKTNNT